jgi:uncharacterized protein involved in type VI secretion and phage assembly
MSLILKIDTILGPATKLSVEDPLLPTSLDGQEGVSVPFTYDLVLMRRLEGRDGGEVPIDKILGTSARIGLLSSTADPDNPTYTHRVGSFSQFVKTGLSAKRKLLVYKARLIPAVMLWGGGVTFRVFEKMNVVDIIREVLEGIRARNNDVRYDLSRLKKQDFPRLAYCVQFRESSFGFVCRLMAQHGISYFFDSGINTPHGNTGSGPAENDTLVLVGLTDAGAKPCASGKLDAKNVDIQGGDDIDNEKTIANFNRSYRSSQRAVSIGNFNPISPTDPLHAEKTIAPSHDVLRQADTSSAAASLLRREEFPAPVEIDPDAKKPDQFVTAYADETIRQEELDVFSVSGMVKNPSFVAGRTFLVEHDETLGQFDQRTFQLTMVKISAFENSYMNNIGLDDILLGLGLDVLNAATFNIGKSVDSDKLVDSTAAMVGGAWGNYLQNEQGVALAKWLYPGSPITKQMTDVLVLPALQGGLGQQWAALLLGNISSTIKDVFNAHKGDFTIQFGAVPWDQGLRVRPQVSAPRPVANGPQLATVVGPKGSKKGQIYADHQLGRVRVRFPWQLKVPPAQSGAAADEGKARFGTDRTTAWVPVSQAWAGTRFGTQFFPRIGDQVLVEHIDGDPERPIISGRVYHADSNYTHLPFSNKELAGQPVTTKTVVEAQGTDLTLSGIETRSTPKPDNGYDRYHLLRFDDRYNDEQLLLRSQGRMDVTAKCCSYDTTEGDRHDLVTSGKDADGKTIGGGSAFKTVGGESDEHIGKSRYEAVDADHQLTVKGDTQFNMKGDWVNVVGGNLSLNAATIVIEASQKLTLKVGGSTLVLNPCGVYLDGAMIYNQCGGPADTAADAHIKDVADATKADPGDDAYMRTKMAGGCGGSGGGGGGGGKRGEQTVPAQHGPECTQDPDHMICVPLPQLCTPDGTGR